MLNTVSMRAYLPLVMLALLGFLLVSVLAEAGTETPGDVPAISCGMPAWPQWPPSRPAALVAPPGERWLEDWEEGPNFACTARLMPVSCGSGCASAVLHDAATGVWLSLPFAIHRDSGQREALLDFDLHSDALTATGWLNEEAFGVFRFRWDGRRLWRLHDE